MVLKAKDIMHKDFMEIEDDLTVAEASRKMVERRRGYAIVNHEDRPVGMLTEWDFLEKLVAPGKDPSSITVSVIMTSPLVVTDKETPTEEVVELMVQKGIRRLVVTDAGRVVGVITSRDILSIFKKYVDEISSIVARFSASPF